MSDNQNQVREAAAREYRSRPALQSEFSSEQAYVAFCCAMNRGAARISPATILHFKNNPAHASSGAARIAPAAVTHLQNNHTHASNGTSSQPATDASVMAAMHEFQSTHQSYYRTELVAFVASRTGLSVHDASEAVAETVVRKQGA